MSDRESGAGSSGAPASASTLPLRPPAPAPVAPTPTVVCAGCGRAAAPGDPLPLRCRFAVPGDDIDHVMTPVVDASSLTLPGPDDDPDPFVRYRAFLHSYRVARAAGWSDARFVGLVEDLERRIAAVDGRSFVVTPFGRADALSERLGFAEAGGAWVKDETGNVSGSHKARHLMGVMLEILVAEELGLIERDLPLAIASCGNAALAGAVVARAAERRLDVFVPVEADALVVDRLHALGANVVACERRPGVTGDPTYHRLKEAIGAGAIPFTCQGNENGLVIQGCETLGLEIVSELVRAGQRLDVAVVQVGGAALASAVALAFEHALAVGTIERRPRLYAVQTEGAWPLRRAFDRVVAEIAAGATVDEAVDWAVHHRSAVMWPWEDEPHSVAHGILDDETYDWAAVVRAMLETGGRPVVVDEDTLRAANDLAYEATAIPVDHTGSSGLAGLLALRRIGEIEADENVAVLFTGVRREDP